MALHTSINRRSNRTLYLIGHVDVALPGIIKQWKYDPYSGLILPTSHNLIVYGRGASDMKGGIVVILETIQRLIFNENRLGCNITCIITNDEERGGSYCMKKLVDRMVHNKGWCLNPEPTGLYSCSIGEKGVILIRAKGNSYEEMLSKLPIFLHKKGRVLEQSPVNRDLRKLYAHENIGAFMLDYEVSPLRSS